MAGFELHRDAVGVLDESDCPLAEPDDASRQRIFEDPEQVGAMHLVEGAAPVRRDRVDRAVGPQVMHLQPLHRDREPLELSPQAQPLQDPARARGDLQPGADLRQRRRLLVDLAFMCLSWSGGITSARYITL